MPGLAWPSAGRAANRTTRRSGAGSDAPTGIGPTILALQRSAGNAAVTALLRRAQIQRKPLVATDFKDLAALKKEIDIAYEPSRTGERWDPEAKMMVPEYTPGKVRVSYPKAKLAGVNELSEATVTQAELKKAASGGFGERASLAILHPELITHKGDLEAIEALSFVKKNKSGSAIGHISNAMHANVTTKGVKSAKPVVADAQRNMLLHVFGQAIITTLFGRGSADLAGDIHERDQPSLITGSITAKEERQAIDNYADMINNLYGQELGERLATQLDVDGDTVWTPSLTAEYVNEAQKFIGGEMGWKMTAFTDKDPNIIRFTNLLNEVTDNAPPIPATPATPVKTAAPGKKPVTPGKKPATPVKKPATRPTR